MRVAIVNWSNRAAGGAETYVGLIAPALRRRGHEVFFWHEGDEPHDRPVIEGISDLPSCDASQRGLPAALQALESWNPDVLFVQSLQSPETETALLAVAPAVFFAHAYWGTCISGAKTVRYPSFHPCTRTFGPLCLLHFYPRRCGGLSPLTMIRDYKRQSGRLHRLPRYAAVVTLSEHMRREYLRHGFSAAGVHALPPIDAMATSPLIPEASAPNIEDAPHRWRLAYLGRLDRLKGCSVLVQSLKQVQAKLNNPVTLSIAGEGPDLEHCRALAQSLTSEVPDVRVEFLGWRSSAECRALMEASDVVVVPSLWPEPLGLVGIEALGRGVPVAAFAVGGIPEWLDDGQVGALAPANPPTADGLAAAIVRTVSDPAISARTRERARDSRLKYSVARHLDLLEPVLKGAATAASLTVDLTASTSGAGVTV